MSNVTSTGGTTTSNKILKEVLIAVSAGLVMAGIYYNVSVAVVFYWVLLSITTAFVLGCHVAIEYSEASKSYIKDVYAKVKERSWRKILNNFLWTVAWTALLVYTERYNLLGVFIGCHLATQALWLRVKSLEA